jgi:recombination protein RecA
MAKAATKEKKAKKDGNDDFFQMLAQEMGGQVLKGTGASKYFIDTGNLALNFVCTGSRFMKGGIPTGITEIYGPSASAKSLIGYALMGRNQRAGGYNVLFDCERASNETFAQAAGHLDPAKVVVLQPMTIEECQAKIIGLTQMIRKRDKTAPILFIWDSIGVTMCDREARELKLPPNYTKEQYKKIVGGKEQPGERAKAASKFLRIINPFLDENNVALFVINQVRYKIGVMYGNPETTAGGGNGLPFYANTRLRSQGQKRIDHKVRKVAIGCNLKFANKKCRSGPPYMESEGVQLFFSNGIHPLSGLLSALIAAGRVEGCGKGRYKVNEPWAGGKEYTFQGSLSRNDVPLDLLLQCPGVIDAESEDEVREYLADFSEVLNLSNSDDIEEKADNLDELGIDLTEEEGDGDEGEPDDEE